MTFVGNTFVHAESSTVGGGEHTLCGEAPEAFECDFAEQPVVYAEAGQLVTCPLCRTIIDHCKTFKNYRAPK